MAKKHVKRSETPTIRMEVRVGKGDEWLYDLKAYLVMRRQLSETIRDGLRLIVDLRAGRNQVLYELFPHLVPPQVHFVGDNVGDNVGDRRGIPPPPKYHQ